MSNDTTAGEPAFILKADRPITDGQAAALTANQSAPPATIEWQLIQALGRIEYLETEALITLAGELRRFQKAYGRASATIAAERGVIARLRAGRELDRRAELLVGNEAALAQIEARCMELLAGNYRHIACGEVLKIIGHPQ